MSTPPSALSCLSAWPSAEVRFLVGIGGASGAVYGVRFLKRCPGEKHLILSRGGEQVLRLETGLGGGDLAAEVRSAHDDRNLAAPWSSGSNRHDGFIIIPCSLSTLGKIGSGIADTLITRAAQVALKERMPLIVCVRETPWSTITLRRALEVSEAGGIVMPVAPPWYRDPESMEAVVDGFCDKVLGVLGVSRAPGWREEELG